MARPIVALDIDDVLSHSAPAIAEYSNKRWGYVLTVEDFDEQLSKMWQVDEQEAERRWAEYMASGAMATYDAVVDAQGVLIELRNNYRIVAVTSRQSVALDVTREWLGQNYPGLIEEVISSGIYGNGHADAHKLTKADILHEIGAKYLIDDQPKHCIGAAGVGVDAVLFGDYAWNRNAELPARVTRCKDWSAVLKYFDEVTACA